MGHSKISAVSPFSAVGVLEKKRHGLPLTEGEIRFFVEQVVRGGIPDYQIAAFLMAVAVNGMSAQETWALTRAMRDSGRRLDFSGVPGPKVDKHSTGGVGDGVSLVIAPLVATFGVRVPMMAGRGLGHTGGTLDKLEAIPGFGTDPPVTRWKAMLKQAGCLIVSPSKDVAPADAVFYALRDVTATVGSLPLIVSSILSKKLAEGAGALVFDVKVGSGALLSGSREARELAWSLVDTSRRAGCRAVALLTDMEEPLGRAVGNALEIRQAVEVLHGGGPEDFVELVLEISVWMLRLAGVRGDSSSLRKILHQRLRTGEALPRFKAFVKAQGGDPRVADNPDGVLSRARMRRELLSPRSGYLRALNARLVGSAAVELGAGRKRKEDTVDPAAGLLLHKKVGDRVRRGELLATLCADSAGRLEAGLSWLKTAYGFGHSPPARRPLIHSILR